MTHGFYYTRPNTLVDATTDGIHHPLAADLFIIYQDIAHISVQHWPGELWFVKGIKPKITDSGLIHCQQIQPLKPLPLSLLFGHQGQAVCSLLDHITSLSAQQIEQLTLLATPMANEAYSRVWNNWLTQLETNHYEHYEDSDHSGTLAIGINEYTSPIYSGLLLINQLVEARIKLLQQNNFNIPNHHQACAVLLQAAMGLGAAQYSTPQDLNLLLAGWDMLNKI